MDKNKRILYNDIDIKLLIGNLSINVLNVNYEPPIPSRFFSNHTHSSYEFHFIPQGKGILRVFKSTYEITPGTFYLTGPGIYHEQVADKNDPMVEYCINLEFRPLKKKHSKLSKDIIEIENILYNTHFWFGKDEYATHEYFLKIFSELENNLLGYNTNIQTLISQIIINVARYFTSQKKAASDVLNKEMYDKRRRILDDFFRNYKEQLKPEALAELIGVSVRQLDRIMLHYYSMSFKAKLISTRFEIAKDLLISTNLTVDEIADKAGFCSSSYFCKLFKERFGITPTLYRKK